MSDAGITFAVVGALVVLFVLNRLPVELVAVGAALTLYATGVLSIEQAVGGFGAPAVLFIASLFVVSAGLEASGVTTVAGQKLMRWAGPSGQRLVMMVILLVAALAALVSVNGAVAALLPVVVVTANRLVRPSSQLLMPLAFGAHAGSLLALTGTPVNVLVSEALKETTGSGFGLFEFALVGLPLLAGVLVITVLFGEDLLPNRPVRHMPADLSRYAHTVAEEYMLNDGTFWLRVRLGSPMAGLPPAAVDLREYSGLALTGVQSRAGPVEQAISVDDILIVRGPAEGVERLASEKGLGIRSGPEDLASTLLTGRFGLAEVVIPSRSGLIGQTVFPGMATTRGNIVVLGVQRHGKDQGPGETSLDIGDHLLLQGTWEALDQDLGAADVLVVDSPKLLRKQAAPAGVEAKRATAILVAMVVLLATGVVPAVVAGLLAAGAMVVTRVLSLQDAYDGVNWTTVVLVGALIPLSTAMTETGAAADIAHGLVVLVGEQSPYFLLLGLFVLTALFGQLISSLATALIMIPIGLAGAAEMGIAPEPVLMCLTVAAAASFLTPVATPVNLMVMGPAGYEFGDYWKLGLPMMLLFMVVATFLVPVFWSF